MTIPAWQDEAIRNCPVPFERGRFSYMSRAIQLDPDAWIHPLTVEMWPRRGAGLKQAFEEAEKTGLVLERDRKRMIRNGVMGAPALGEG